MNMMRLMSTTMKMIPIEVSGGVLRLPKSVELSAHAHLAVLAFEEGENGIDLERLADAGGAFDFLREEPELYELMGKWWGVERKGAKE